MSTLLSLLGLLLPCLTLSSSSTCPSPTHCITSLVSGDNYALGATVLAKSLRATRSIDSTTRLIAIVPLGGLSEVSQSWLEQVGGFEIVHPPEYHKDEILGGQRKDLASKKMAAAKLWAWSLENCTRVLYMDSDSFVRAKMDILTNDAYWKGNISGVQEYDLNRDDFKGGHLALRPSLARYASMMAVLDTATNLTNSDQTLLNLIFRDEWRSKPVNERLPREGLLCSAYCALVHFKPHIYTDIFARMLKSAPIFDFQGQSKPWNFPKQLQWKACEPLREFVQAWTALLLSPTAESAEKALAAERFGQMQTVFETVQDAYEAYAKGGPALRAYYVAAAQAVKAEVDLTKVFA